MYSLSHLAIEIAEYFEAKDQAREESLRLSRLVIRNSSRAIRAVHRHEFGDAVSLIDESREALARIDELLLDHGDIMHAGFVDDAKSEYAEAMMVYSIITSHEIPSIERIGVRTVDYLAGLGDLTGELRRHILDLIREGRPEDGEYYLGVMEEVFHLLVLFDYPDVVTHGLRRKGDIARSQLERTRGDLTNALEQKRLVNALQKFEDKLKEAGLRL